MKLCGFEAGLAQPFFLIAGPCVIESRQMAFDTAGLLQEITRQLGIPFIYKSSFDKANRSSGKSFRGPGIAEGLQILADVKAELGVPVLTDIHDQSQVDDVAAVVDVLQTPAFLCRQTDFIQACAATLKPVNIKKGQFLAPHDMLQVVSKARDAAIAAGGDGSNIMVCERGASFGYNNLVSDMRSLAITSHPCGDRVSGGVRCNTFSSVTWRPRYVVWWSTRVCSCSGARGGCSRYRRPVHGNPSRSRPCLVRRP